MLACYNATFIKEQYVLQLPTLKEGVAGVLVGGDVEAQDEDGEAEGLLLRDEAAASRGEVIDGELADLVEAGHKDAAGDRPT